MKCEDTIIPFGKHRNKRLGDILADDPAYLDWLQTADIRSPALAAAVAEINLKYSGQIEQAVDSRHW